MILTALPPAASPPSAVAGPAAAPAKDGFAATFSTANEPDLAEGDENESCPAAELTDTQTDLTLVLAPAPLPQLTRKSVTWDEESAPVRVDGGQTAPRGVTFAVDGAEAGLSRPEADPGQADARQGEPQTTNVVPSRPDTAAERLWAMQGFRPASAPGDPVVAQAGQKDADQRDHASQNADAAPDGEAIDDRVATPDAPTTEKPPDDTNPGHNDRGKQENSAAVKQPDGPDAWPLPRPAPKLRGSDLAVGTMPDRPAASVLPVQTAAPPAASPLPLSAPMVISATQTGTDGVTLTLAPEELGRVHLHMITEGDRMVLAVAVERPETLDLLRKNADQLLLELRQAGFSHSTLSFAQGQQSQFSGREPDPPPAVGIDSSLPALPSQLPAIAIMGAGLDLRL